MISCHSILYLSKYNNNNYYYCYYSSGAAWLNDVKCFHENCLSQCTGGDCPSSSVSCSNAAYVTCSMSINFNHILFLLILRI